MNNSRPSKAPGEHFELTSDHGVTARYHVIPYGASAGFKLLNRIFRIIGEAGGALAASVDGDSREDPLDADVDIKGAVGALSVLAKMILEEGGPDLCRDILAHTTRQIEGEPGWTEVGKVRGFDDAYRANYGELFEAMYEVLKVNYGPCLRARLERFGIGSPEQLLEKLKS